LVIFLTMIAGVGTAQSQTGQPIVFPARGQTQEQTEKDKADCNAWAKQQSGYDPLSAGLQTPQAPYNPQVTQQPAPAPPPQGGVVRGGARGAAGGAAIGAIAGNAGKGAAIGAATGGAVGGIRQRRNAQSQAAAQQQAYQEEAASNQQASQQEAADQQKIDAYNRAFSACMEGKGYTVK
jgi:hypothetical protein